MTRIIYLITISIFRSYKYTIEDICYQCKPSNVYSFINSIQSISPYVMSLSSLSKNFHLCLGTQYQSFLTDFKYIQKLLTKEVFRYNSVKVISYVRPIYD